MKVVSSPFTFLTPIISFFPHKFLVLSVFFFFWSFLTCHKQKKESGLANLRRKESGLENLMGLAWSNTLYLLRQLWPDFGCASVKLTDFSRTRPNPFLTCSFCWICQIVVSTMFDVKNIEVVIFSMVRTSVSLNYAYALFTLFSSGNNVYFTLWYFLSFFLGTCTILKWICFLSHFLCQQMPSHKSHRTSIGGCVGYEIFN